MSPVEEKRKRQARGEARIQSLLDAAESVFARVGYSKATTNEIAAQAGVSPATLYQFFNNKEAIANSLALRYIGSLGRHHEDADLSEIAKLPMKSMVEWLIMPIFEFHKTHPAFLALFIDAPLAVEIKQAKMAITTKLVARVSQLLKLRNPALSEKDAAYHAEVAMIVYKGFVCEANEASGERKAKLIESLIEHVAMQLDKASL